ncbi:DUF1579 family protein [Mongoliibacter ruber]|nr:DUF1579 family protein [Mongoliibacter ruber]
MKATILTSIMLMISSLVIGQVSSQEAIKKLDFLLGEWEGQAKAVTGPGQVQELHQFESVELRMGEKMLFMEGKGYQENEMVFNAVGLVTFDEGKQEYEMQSWLATGEKTKAYFKEKGDKFFEWGFELPNGKIRYFIKLDEKGRWSESGEFSPNGEVWYPSFEMLLSKIEK